MAANPPDFERVESAVNASLREHWGVFLAEGIVLVILGFIAMVVPPLATLAVEVLIGWILLLSGVLGLISTFRMQRTPGFWWSLLSAIVAIGAGIVLLRWPLSGAFSLTVILTVFLAVEGIASIMLALSHSRGFAGRWGILLISGVVDLVLAGIIFSGLPGAAVWAIGLLVGINMVFGGASLIAMALHARLPPTGDGRAV
jgi:uncharacterized membrane protein HdeD (DUF308 family)